MLLREKDEEWVLYYFSPGKGMIPYQMITNFDLLETSPENEFFEKKD